MTPALRCATVLLLALPHSLLAQGGRDTGKGAPLVLFVRSERTVESKDIYDAAWKALEPHFGVLARERLYAFDSSLLVVGGVEGDRATGVPPELPAEMLACSGVDWVVIEADGSRMLPVKAPAAHEPVVPNETSLLVVVVGVDALSGPIREVSHRPEQVSAITGLTPEETLTPEALATLLTS